MKKITIATVLAGAALSGFCLESSNIVGYRAQELADQSKGGGFKMISPSFLTIGKNGCHLSELIPTGYEYNEDMVYVAFGTTGQFNIQVLNAEGKVVATYGWVRTNMSYDPEGWEDDGHWTTPEGEVVPGGANDILFTPGTGLYFKAPGNAGDEGTPYPLMVAGQVFNGTVPVKFLDDGGFQTLGNPYPTSIMLSSMIPEGYEYNEDMVYVAFGTTGQFNIQVLSAEGKVSKTYGWVRTNMTYDPEGWSDDGHWTTPEGEVVFNKETGKYDNDVEFKQGDGFYFKSPGHEGDDPKEHPYTMRINYPLAK